MPERTLLSYRSGGVADAAAIAELFGSVRSTMPYVPKLHTSDEDRAYFAHQLGSHESQVALLGETMAGFALFDSKWLYHLYVSTDQQGRGIGPSYCVG